MVGERGEFLCENKSNRGTAIVQVMPMAKAENWNSSYPVIATATSTFRYQPYFSNQEEKCDYLAGALYAKGLMLELVGGVFYQIYRQHDSKFIIGRISNNYIPYTDLRKKYILYLSNKF